MHPSPAKSILLVDDEKSYVELMTLLLTDHLDLQVHGFTCPVRALAALPAAGADVVVTDYYMPQVNGLDFIRQAAALAPAASFLLISGHNLSMRESEFAHLPALRGFLPKPFGWRTLAGEILRIWPAGRPAPAWRADLPTL